MRVPFIILYLRRWLVSSIFLFSYDIQQSSWSKKPWFVFFRNIFSRVPRIILSTINGLKLLWINVYVWKIRGNEKKPCCFHMKPMCYFWITNRIVLSHICITSTCQRKRYKLKMAKFYVWFIEIKRIFLNIMTSKKATLGRYRSRYVIICNSFLVFLSKKK